MTWSIIGATNPPAIQAHDVTSFSLTPGGVGNLILLEITDAGSFCTGPTSSNATWTQISSNFTSSVVGTFHFNIWAGTVTSTSTATVSMVGTTGTTLFAVGQEFHSTVGSWAFDVSGTVDAATASFPVLTPTHGAGELYFVYTINATSATNGSTSGYTYGIDGQGNGDAMNPNCTNSAQSPTAGDSNTKAGIAVMMYETGGQPQSLTLPNRQLPNFPVYQTFSAGRMGGGHSY